MANLLIIEDHKEVREELHAFLIMQGHTVWTVESLSGFHTQMESAPVIDVAVIDLILPDGEGFEAMIELRRRSKRTGIILLTAKSSMKDRLRGLQDGADHYLIKPFSLIELGAVIDALLRRVGLAWVFELKSSQLTCPEGITLQLNAFELGLFELLCAPGGTPVTRESLVHSMGFEWKTYDLRRIDTAISRLRARWRHLSNRDLPLKTLHRTGYCFSEPLKKSD